MRRFAKALAVFVPLFLAFSCSDECKGPEDCAPGELCIRPIGADGERGATQCVPGNNTALTCTTETDCGTSGLFLCVAQRCILKGGGTTTATPAVDGGLLDGAPIINPDAAPLNPDAAPLNPDASDDGGTPATACEQYCNDVLANCTGANEIFTDRATCLTTCAAYPSIGTATTAGDSVECRSYHGGAPAMGDPITHCPHAGPGGGGVCGERCEGYCDQVMNNCMANDAQYPNRAACLASCTQFPVINTATVSGNSVECRTYHASFPAAGDPATHCAHAGTSGGGVCGSRCDAYCDQAVGNCGTAVYADRQSCMLACATFPAGGMENDTIGNTLQCRTYHASFPSAGDPMTHCPHAAIAGGGVCGNLCDVYCDFLDANCVAPNNQYPDRASCLTTCTSSITLVGPANAVSGDSVQCRSYHASFPAAADPVTHCPHAGENGGGVCVP